MVFIKKVIISNRPEIKSPFKSYFSYFSQKIAINFIETLKKKLLSLFLIYI